MHDTRPPQLSPSPLLKPLHPAEKLPQRKPASDREKRKMGSRAALFVLVIVLCYGLAMAVSSVGDEDWRRKKEGREDWRREREETEEEETEDWFLLQDSKKVVTTDAGEMRVVRSLGGRIVDRPMHIGFIAMEPKTLFIPQYLDSSLILFIRRGTYT
jgi:hypothetical protein